jgi:hypothetical protein
MKLFLKSRAQREIHTREMLPLGKESRIRPEPARRRLASSWLSVPLIVILAATACRSRVIRVSLTNISEQPVSAIVVDYPSATFGVNTLAPGKTFQYTIKPVNSGVLKIQFTDANGKVHTVTGPDVKKDQEGTIAIRINQNSASAGSALE